MKKPGSIRSQKYPYLFDIVSTAQSEDYPPLVGGASAVHGQGTKIFHVQKVCDVANINLYFWEKRAVFAYVSSL
jgi:hypothetical protein